MSSLKDFYDNLPEQSSPKSDFVRTIAEKCQVHEQTVRFWIHKGFKPSRKEFYQILTEVTGIPEEHLFDD